MSATRSALITGAAGFLGRSFARALADTGFRVTGLDRTLPPAPTGGAQSPFAEFHRRDLLDDATLAEDALGGWFDAVVHLAGVLPGHATRGELFAVNAGGTSALLERFARVGCHLILLSSGLVYGKQRGPFREDMTCFPAEPYGQSKLAAEDLVQRWGRATRSPVAVLRASVVYGSDAPRGMLLVSLMDALREQRPFPMTPGEQLRDFLHVEDAALAVASVIERRAAGTWNLASGESVSVKQVAELGAAIAGRPELLRLGELPYRPNETFDYRLDPSALERAVGFRPRIDLAAGLTRLWKETT